jgi:hypothetical protein
MLTRPHAGSVVLAVSLGASLALFACSTESHAHANKSPATAKSETASTAAVTQAQISDELTATAAVIAVDKPSRTVTLRSTDGRVFQIVAPPEVRNFDQIAVGNELRVTYRVALAAKLLPPGSEHTAPTGGAVATRAAVGDRPAAAAGAGVSVRVKVVSVDPANDIVVCSLSSGELVAHKVRTDEGRAFVKHLKQGDLVQLDYAEAMAISVEEVAPTKG